MNKQELIELLERMHEDYQKALLKTKDVYEQGFFIGGQVVIRQIIRKLEEK